MDVCEREELHRAPLGKNNAAISRKPRVKEVSSRYMSGISSTSLSMPRRFPSPTFARGGAPSAPTTLVSKRPQSVEPRRPTTPSSRPATPLRSLTPSTPSRPATPVQDSGVEMQIFSKRSLSGRNHEGLWPSMRSLSVSFQSDTYSLPVTKREKPISDHTLKPSANVAHRQSESSPARKVTPERKRTPLRGKNASDQLENSKPIEHSQGKLVDQHRWPGRVGGKVFASSLTRSVDLTDRPSRSGLLPLPARGISPIRRSAASDIAVRSLQKSGNEVGKKGFSDGNGRVEHKIGSVSDLRGTRKLARSAYSEIGGSTIPSAGMKSTTHPVLHHPPSPTLTSLTASRGVMLSPSRTRQSAPVASLSSVVGQSPSSSTSVLSFSADVRKGKKGANRIEDAHQLRILHNRYLQWRFVNAQSDTTLAIQKILAEDLLYTVWKTMSELRESVLVKRITLQRHMQDMKLDSILGEQVSYLDDWDQMDREHSISLLGAFEALQACTLRLPVTGGARADVQMVKDAVSSAVDVMQAMGSSICSLSLRVEGTNSLVSELACVAAQERAMLKECGDLLASITAMQVEKSSLRSHLIQLKEANS